MIDHDRSSVPEKQLNLPETVYPAMERHVPEHEDTIYCLKELRQQIEAAGHVLPSVTDIDPHNEFNERIAQLINWPSNSAKPLGTALEIPPHDLEAFDVWAQRRIDFHITRLGKTAPTMGLMYRIVMMGPSLSDAIILKTTASGGFLADHPDVGKIRGRSDPRRIYQTWRAACRD